jgi:cyclic beta-1,2-glucan synthetase
LADLRATLSQIDDLFATAPGNLEEWDAWLEKLEQATHDLPSQVQALAPLIQVKPQELQNWSQHLADQVARRRRELTELAPWIALLRTMPAATDLPPALQGRWHDLQQMLRAPVSVAEVHSWHGTALAKGWESELPPEHRKWLSDVSAAVQASRAEDWLRCCQTLADRASKFAGEMDFKVLYNEQRSLFAIGYNLAVKRLDNSFYDFLASEARLASFLAIARGDVEKKHWFQLGRPLTRAAGRTVLLSWGGTMFEYLMPQLLLHAYPGTLLAESCIGAVTRQMQYGRECGVPWGISESGYAALDTELDYQYQSFGVPGLGLKRGLARDLVIAPYATALALLIRPREALHNLTALSAEGGEGRYGFYEAIDYTRDRLLKKRRSWVIRSYMAHHQGMSLLALTNCLLDAP